MTCFCSSGGPSVATVSRAVSDSTVVCSGLSTYSRAPVVQEALAHLARSVRHSYFLSGPCAVRDFLQVLLADRPHEVFTVVFLDAQNQVIDALEMFRGSLTQTSVYPREVVIESLARQANGVILAHNHPSGSPDPSTADIALTKTLQSALSLVDVRVLDHFIVTRSGLVSLAERGLI
jgi:DNA repair protein RadC